MIFVLFHEVKLIGCSQKLSDRMHGHAILIHGSHQNGLGDGTPFRNVSSLAIRECTCR
jgi:hypothetical protein